MTVPTPIDYTYRARLHRAIDADTMVLDVDLGFQVRAHITVRLRGVNAPERTAPGGPQATAWLLDTIENRPLLMTSYRDRQSFARWVCDVWVTDVAGGRVSVADAMIAAGHAVRYPA